MKKTINYILFVVSALLVLVWLCLAVMKVCNKDSQVSPLSKYYFTDGKGVFIRESWSDDHISDYLLLNKQYLPDVDMESFVVLEDEFARDKNHLFYLNYIVNGVDLSTLKVICGMAYDKDYVYDCDDFTCPKRSDIRVNTKKLQLLSSAYDDSYQYWTDDSRIYAYKQGDGLQVLDTLRQPLDTINSCILRNGNNIICCDTIVPFDTIKSITRLERNYVLVNDSIVKPYYYGDCGIVSKEEYEEDISSSMHLESSAEPSSADFCIALIVYLVLAFFVFVFFTLMTKLPWAMRIMNAFILAPTLLVPFVFVLMGMAHFPSYYTDSIQRLIFFTLDYYAVFLFQIVYGAKQVHLRFQKPLLTALYYPLSIATFILFYALVFWVEDLSVL